MRKLRIFLLALLCALLLVGCGKQNEVSGYITNYEQGSVSITTNKGKTYDFVLEEPEPLLIAVDGLDQEAFRENWQDCYAHVTYRKARGLRYAETVFVHHKIYRNAMELTDGTPIDIWTDGVRREYWLEDGTVLLLEENSGSPENSGRWNELLYYEEFPEAARQGILDYYGEMGLRYDLTTLLEEAYRVYGFVEEYNTQMVSQFTGIEAWNDSIICCQMNLTIPQERTNGYADYFCEGAVFDRETGEHISNYDLFVLTPEELEAYLLDFCDMEEDNIQLNMKPEQIVLGRDGGIEFFLMDRVEDGVHLMLQISLPAEQAREILQPWAIIKMEE